MPNQATIDALADAFRAAAAAAQAVQDTEDSGTCNLDSPVYFPARAVRSQAIEAAGREAGISLRVGKWMGTRAVFLHLTEGQAYRRTKMAEAAAKALKAAGVEATVFYQMD